MSSSFIESAAEKAGRPDNHVDATASDWASRAFACIALAGGIDGAIDPAVADALAECLAKAPVEVLVGGTTFLLAAHQNFNDLNGI